MNPGWTVYGFLGALHFVANAVGLVVGIQHGSISVTGFDTKEEQTELRWTLWSLFCTTAAQGVLWPLFLPVALRGVVRVVRDGKVPSMSITSLKNPFAGLTDAAVDAHLSDILEWRGALPDREGSPVVTEALLHAAVLEAEALFQEWPAARWRAQLLSELRAVIDAYQKEPPHDG